MKYCKLCLQTDTRPGTKFDVDGVCPACNFIALSRNIDWKEREKELEALVHFGKTHSVGSYDCIMGVSGGKDSTRQALFVKHNLGMNPLLVCLGYPPEQVHERGMRNLGNLVEQGFDCVLINTAPQTWKTLMRKAFLEHGNWARSTELALFGSVPRLAIAYQIPLIWWGENPGLQLGDLNTIGRNGWDGNSIRNANTLAGGDASWLANDKILPEHILQYYYPSRESMDRAKLQIVYLGYFWKNWSLVDNAVFSTLRGLEVREDNPADIGDYEGVTALDEDWVNLNQMIKYLKYGFGRTSDYVNEAIRMGRMTREEAIAMAKRYDGKCARRYILSFCEYIEITEAQFWETVDRFVNRKLFEKNASGVWQPKFEVGEDFAC